MGNKKCRQKRNGETKGQNHCANGAHFTPERHADLRVWPQEEHSRLVHHQNHRGQGRGSGQALRSRPTLQHFWQLTIVLGEAASAKARTGSCTLCRDYNGSTRRWSRLQASCFILTTLGEVDFSSSVVRAVEDKGEVHLNCTRESSLSRNLI